MKKKVKKQNTSHFYQKTVLLLIGVAVAIIALEIYGLYITHARIAEQIRSPQQQPPNTPVPTTVGIVFKDIPDNASESAVFLQNPQTKGQTFFAHIPFVNRNHYHAAEYHNGNLYIITRPDGEIAYTDDIRKKEVLWKYTKEQEPQKLFASRTIDFRVLDDESAIAIITTDSVVLLKQGYVIKTIDQRALTGYLKNPPTISFEIFSHDMVWLKSNSPVSLVALFAIDLNTLTISRYPLDKLGIGDEYQLNTSKKLLAFSTYPMFFDLESQEQFTKQKQPVSLSVYNLVTKQQEQIATQTAKKFQPVWVNETTLAYTDASGKRVEKNY